VSSCVAIIPARGGSKRIPKKNIRSFFGKPLIAYSIEVAKESGLFDDIIVSTDDEKIAKVALEYGASVPFMRDKALADDFTGTGEVVEWTIKELEKRGKRYEYVCTIYATAPFLQVKYLKEGFEKLKNSDAIMSFGVTSFEYPIWRSFRIKNNRCEMFWRENFPKRSQDLEEAYHDVGQFYWEKVGVKKQDIAFGRESIPIIIPRYLVQDIDTLEDWKRAELMYQVLFPDKFDEWSGVKKEIDKKKKTLYVKNSEIYFISIGKNVGYEIYGKDELFLRPVLVYKKLSHHTFIGIPLTSKEKHNSYKFSYKKDKNSYALLNQIRVFDTKRIVYKSGKISKEDFEKLKNRVNDFIKITPHQKGGGCITSNKKQRNNENIIAKKEPNV